MLCGRVYRNNEITARDKDSLSLGLWGGGIESVLRAVSPVTEEMRYLLTYANLVVNTCISSVSPLKAGLHTVS